MERQSALVASAVVIGEPDRSAAADAEFRKHIQANLAAGYRLAAVIVGDLSEAEDATHDAIERAWRSRRQLREMDRFDAWFQRILVNSCRDRVRQRRARPVLLTLTGDLAESAAGSHSSDLTSHVAERDAIGRALSQLDIDRRIVVALRFYLDLEVEEIGRRLGIPAGTVKSRLHRAIKDLRTSWEASK